MARLLVGTDGEHTSIVLCDYLEGRVTSADIVYAVNSLRGEDKDALPGEDEADIVREGREAIELIEQRLDGQTTVETHQLVRGNDPAEDLRSFADEHDIDELVVGIQQRSSTERFIFGSTAQTVLRTTSRPVVAIPLKS